MALGFNKVYCNFDNFQYNLLDKFIKYPKKSTSILETKFVKLTPIVTAGGNININNNNNKYKYKYLKYKKKYIDLKLKFI